MLWVPLFLLALTADPPPHPVVELIAQGQWEAARQALAMSGVTGPEADRLRGLIEYNTQNYSKAVEALRSAVTVEAEDSVEWQQSVLMLGQSYYLLSRHSDAIPWLEKAKRSPARRTEVLYMLGNSYIQTRRAELAAATFGEMFGVDPSSAAAKLISAQMMVRLEQEDLARAELEAVIRQEPKLPGARLLLGELDTFRGNYDRAAALLEEELKIDPVSAEPYYKLADVYTRREQWTEAIPLLQKAIWLNPTMSGPFILLGKSYLKTKDFANAEHMLRRAIEIDQRNYSAQFLLGQTLIAQGHTQEGREILRKAQQLKPVQP